MKNASCLTSTCLLVKHYSLTGKPRGEAHVLGVGVAGVRMAEGKDIFHSGGASGQTGLHGHFGSEAPAQVIHAA